MIKVENLNYTYKKGGFSIKNASLEIREGYLTVVLGHNAGGKTTLFKLLYGAVFPDSGSVTYSFDMAISDYFDNSGKHEKTEYNAQSFTILTPENAHVMRQNVAIVSRDFPIASNLQIGEMVELYAALYPAFDRKEFENLTDYFALNSSENRDDFSKKCPDKFSTGEIVKLSLAFALAIKPRIIILDEPFANLDPVVKTDIMMLIQKKIAEDGLGVLLSTHLLEEINDVADYIYVIEKGSIIKSGDRESLLSEAGTTELKELLKKE